jgi:hypothetical protein
MTDYTTKTLAELRRDWCERVGWEIEDGMVWDPDVGESFDPEAIDGWALAGLVLDEMRRRGWRFRLEDDYNPVDDPDKAIAARFYRGNKLGSGLDPAIDRAALIASLRALDAEEEAK